MKQIPHRAVAPAGRRAAVPAFACLAALMAVCTPLPARGQTAVAAAEGAGVVPGNYGFLMFRVSPGFKQIYIDREATIGFADRIMVNAGVHLVEILAPPGYADTNFRVEVPKGSERKMEIRLRNLVTGHLAQAPRSYSGEPGSWRTRSLWNSLKISSLTLGLFTGLLALREEQLAAQSLRRYESARAEHDALHNHVDTHVTQRNVLVVVSLVSLATGIFLWSF